MVNVYGPPEGIPENWKDPLLLDTVPAVKFVLAFLITIETSLKGSSFIFCTTPFTSVEFANCE
jgi:hypothetical protein